MTFQFRFRVLSEHTHVRIFSGEPDALGLSGNLIMATSQWQALRAALQTPAPPDTVIEVIPDADGPRGSLKEACEHPDRISQ